MNEENRWTVSGNWYHWKWRRLAFAPTCWDKGIGDSDGEWFYIGMGFYFLIVDLRQGGLN